MLTSIAVTVASNDAVQIRRKAQKNDPRFSLAKDPNRGRSTQPNQSKELIMSINILSHTEPATPAPVTCPSWCEVAATGAHDTTDCACFGPAVETTLSLEAADEYGDLNEVAVYAERENGSPQVRLDKNGAPKVLMTVPEAQALLDQLTAAIALANRA